MICGPVRASPGGGVDKIVAAGGYAISIHYDITEIYDVATDSWSVGELGFIAAESLEITPCLCTAQTAYKTGVCPRGNLS